MILKNSYHASHHTSKILKITWPQLKTYQSLSLFVTRKNSKKKREKCALIKQLNAAKLRRYAWWQFILAQYWFSIERIPGKDHHLQDVLTREFKPQVRMTCYAGTTSWKNLLLRTPQQRLYFCQKNRLLFPHGSSTQGDYPFIDLFVTSARCISSLMNNLK